MNPFVPVLTYQKIGYPPKHSRLTKEWTSVKQLNKTLSWLQTQGYHFITPLDLQKSLPEKPVMLVFMGGYQSFYEVVFPLLQKYNAFATLLIATDTLGTYNSWQNPYKEPWQNILSAKQLKELYQSGLVQIGSLGLDGHNLLEDTPDYARSLLEESLYRLEKLHKIKPCAAGFWPNSKDKKSHAVTIGNGLNVPVITSRYGKNSLTEKKFLCQLRPGWWTWFLLWRNFH